MTLFDGADEAGGTTAGPAVCKLVVAYDGAGFRGFAAQPDQRTVAGVLAHGIEKVLRHPVELTGAGRTDAGVHAWGQVVSFDALPGLDPDRLMASLNAMLGPEVVVRAADLVPAGFDARRSAHWREYRYTVCNRRVADPFLARTSWHVPAPLDVRALRLAADPFVGEHDFASFCRKGPEGTTTVRRVLRSSWVEIGDGLLVYEVRATAFCQQMVRAIVGTLVDVGLGRRRPGEMLGILRGRDRDLAGPLAPPEGLCLREVGYRP